MTVSNHVLAGTVIALAVRQPLIALPLAFVSHFILDAIPHFGYARAGYKEIFKHRLSFAVLLLDIAGTLAVLVVYAVSSWLALAAAALALLPDAVWPYRYFYYDRNEIREAMHKFTQFHTKIQWCERPWGIAVEIPLFAAGFILLRNFG